MSEFPVRKTLSQINNKMIRPRVNVTQLGQLLRLISTDVTQLPRLSRIMYFPMMLDTFKISL